MPRPLALFALKLIAVICLIGTVIPGEYMAHADAIPSWRFDDELIIAQPTETIRVFGAAH